MAELIEGILAEIVVLVASYGFWSINPMISIILVVVGSATVYKACTD